MSGKNKVEIRICGKDYTVIGTEPDEYIQRVGLYVDRKMSEILRGNPQLSTSLASILTAVNITDEYFKLQETVEKTKDELSSAVDELNKVKQELARQKDEADILKIKNTELQLELVRKQTENEAMENYGKKVKRSE